jgi:quercetin dioxygenase-like cupin family protein
MTTPRTLALATLLLVHGASGCATAPPLAKEAGNADGLAVPFAQIAFARPIPIVAPEMAALWGDRSEGASGNEEKQPAGAVSALHTHPNDTYAMVLRGRMTHQFEGAPAAPELGPGSFYTLPRGAPHVSTCLAGEDCLIVYWQPGKLGYDEVKPGSQKGFTAGVARPAEAIELSAQGGSELPHAVLWGEPDKGLTGTLWSQAPGTGSAARTSPSDTHGIVIRGEVSVTIGGGAASPPLGPGSYYVVPAGKTLISSCAGKEECRYLHFEAPRSVPAR